MVVQAILGLFGGLGMFMFGMKLMSAGIEKAAGEKLRNILETCTKNKFIGLIAGIIFTGIIQSSSAATVMVVSFVNAGLMNLYQSVGFILGANIGTTVTAQLMAFKLDTVAPLFLLGGVVMYMFIKKPIVNKIGEIFIGFGLLFLGMSTMSGYAGQLEKLPVVQSVFESLTNPYLAMLTAFILTSVLQSSSATVGILMVLAEQSNGAIPLQVCFFFILGCNIGACVSAMLVSIGAKKDAKRTALIHLVFNIIGSLIFFVALMFIKDSVAQIYQSFSGDSIRSQIANVHTSFKVIQVIMLFPFTNLIVKITYKLVPGEDKKESNVGLQFIGEHNPYTPASALPQAKKEIERMGNEAIDNFERAMQALLENDSQKVEKVCEVENDVDFLNTAITDYLVKVNQLAIPVADKKLLGAFFHVVNDMERISDHAENIAGFAKTKIEENFEFSNTARAELEQMSGAVISLLRDSMEVFCGKHDEKMIKVIQYEDEVDELEKVLEKNHVNRMMYNMCDPKTGLIFTDIVSNLERVADHGTNIAFAMAESAQV